MARLSDWMGGRGRIGGGGGHDRIAPSPGLATDSELKSKLQHREKSDAFSNRNNKQSV